MFYTKQFVSTKFTMTSKKIYVFFASITNGIISNVRNNSSDKEVVLLYYIPFNHVLTIIGCTIALFKISMGIKRVGCMSPD